MSDFTTYSCKVPTRWDTIALDRYGDSTKTEPIHAANGSIPSTDYIPQGTVVLCPVLDITQSSSEVKPPWAD